jgi:hypothetical protein
MSTRLAMLNLSLCKIGPHAMAGYEKKLTEVGLLCTERFTCVSCCNSRNNTVTNYW